MTINRRLALFAAAIALAAAAAPPVASAGVLVRSVDPASCTTQVLERPFLRWLDLARYTLVPDGTLERRAAGWKLSRASVVIGNEPYYVHARGETRSLKLPAGSAATTPPMCVGILHPTLRFFARNTGSILTALRVEVLFEDAAGRVQALPMGALLAGSRWRPTLPLPVVANLLPLLPGQNTAVAFRFTVLGSGTWQVDDVYVDPHRKN